MVSFIGSIIVLILGYVIYGAFVEKVFDVDPNRKTPAIERPDGVDFVPMDWKNVFLIQLLNIAGLGPVFGAIAGALWGPVAFVWIVVGGIFAGATHDYLAGMLSLREGGANLPDMIGKYLGPKVKAILNIALPFLLLLVGAVFMMGPANLLTVITPDWMNYQFWLAVIFVYYFLATVLPIDKIIGRIYPLFGASLLIMVVGIGGGLILNGYTIPEITLANLHPKNLPIWPLMFVSIACGAISGFHATQSPMMARCVTNEKLGRRVFYGAMIAESIVALIWAAAAMTFFGDTAGLAQATADLGGPGGIVSKISLAMMGSVGGVLAILGVIALPITTGDTSFRAARLMIAEMLHIEQKSPINRYKVAIPLFIIGFALTQVNFDIIWRYFAWSNQTVSIFTLYAVSVYLAMNRKFHWLTTIPAVFMSAVSVTYILYAKEGFQLSIGVSSVIGIGVALAIFGVFLNYIRKFSAPVKATMSHSR